MLQTLRIRDFAIIAELELSLAGGFVVFTGETGAGKSIIVDAVQLVLGGRADAAAVREGADTALVEGPSSCKVRPAGRPRPCSNVRGCATNPVGSSWPGKSGGRDAARPASTAGR